MDHVKEFMDKTGSKQEEVLSQLLFRHFKGKKQLVSAIYSLLFRIARALWILMRSVRVAGKKKQLIVHVEF